MSVSRQPFLHDSHVLLWAPTQVWSSECGQMHAPIHGLYHGDLRVGHSLELAVVGSEIEWISSASAEATASTSTGLAATGLAATGLLRGVDGPAADPRVRLDRRQEVGVGTFSDVIRITNARDVPIEVSLRWSLTPDSTPMHEVKAGLNPADGIEVEHLNSRQAQWRHGELVVQWEAENAEFTIGDAAQLAPSAGAQLAATAHLRVEPGTRAQVGFAAAISDGAAVVSGTQQRMPLATDSLFTPASDQRLVRWVQQASADLTALRMHSTALPAGEFIAAGAPWFFTLFGRDSLWAARFLLPVDVDLAASTLAVLAHFQGTKVDPATGEQPGKIMHELRPHVLTIPGEGVSLPPLYYGTIDATPLWIITLYEAWQAGLARDRVAELIPALKRALDWLADFGDSDGDLFLEYFDESGSGLANQGWKDSGDSIQWRDGSLAQGPIALSEVQGYAYQAAKYGAALLAEFGDDAAATAWRDWAHRLKAKFHAEFWVTTPEGHYPAIALDSAKRPVDSLTSNIGHLLGTGILSADQAEGIAKLLVGPGMNSGFGLRTLSADAGGYWPLSYHGGSVWTHDTAIAVTGLMAEGLGDYAQVLVEGLLRAAEAFDYRMPELYSGDSADDAARPSPYPASCRPQGWASGAAIAVAAALRAN